MNNKRGDHVQLARVFIDKIQFDKVQAVTRISI
jgi:hypothetical protein